MNVCPMCCLRKAGLERKDIVPESCYGKVGSGHRCLMLSLYMQMSDAFCTYMNTDAQTFEPASRSACVEADWASFFFDLKSKDLEQGAPLTISAGPLGVCNRSVVADTCRPKVLPRIPCAESSCVSIVDTSVYATDLSERKVLRVRSVRGVYSRTAIGVY